VAGDRHAGHYIAYHHRALNREIGAVLADPDVRAAFAEHGVEPQASSATALGARIRADVQKWRDVIISAGIREN
jgi:tripartite-type tricarboxylate transporter receptor subunit TctC